MNKIEQMILEHGNIEMLCCYVEENYERLSNEMKKALSSFRDRLDCKLGSTYDPYESLYDLPIEDFFIRHGEYLSCIKYRTIHTLQRNGFHTLRDVLKIPRSELHKIKNLGKHSKSFFYIEDTLESVGIDPYFVLK